MTDFATWAEHYGYDPTTDEARDDYAEYVANARLFDALASVYADHPDYREEWA